jgi:hypothetical protein
MTRIMAIVLGIGLGIFWLVELASPGFTDSIVGSSAVRWITWLDLLVVVWAFSIAAMNAPDVRKKTPRGMYGLAGVLLVLWMVGLTSSAPLWITWWNFAFAVAFLVAGIIVDSGSVFSEIGLARRGTYGGDYKWGFLHVHPQWPMLGFHSPSPYTGLGPKKYQRSDTRIEEEINDRLTLHSGIDAREIEVGVKNAEVTLSGTVENRRGKRLAEEIADTVSGVKDVHNFLQLPHKHNAEKSPIRAV